MPFISVVEKLTKTFKEAHEVAQARKSAGLNQAARELGPVIQAQKRDYTLGLPNVGPQVDRSMAQAVGIDPAYLAATTRGPTAGVSYEPTDFRPLNLLPPSAAEAAGLPSASRTRGGVPGLDVAGAGLESAYNVARTDIPEPIRKPAVRALTEAGRISPGISQVSGLSDLANKAGLPLPSGQQIRETVAEVVTPREVWELALEFAPNIGTVDDIMRAAKSGSPEAIAAVRRALDDLAASPQGQAVGRRLASETGSLFGKGEPEDIIRAADAGLPARVGEELAPASGTTPQLSPEVPTLELTALDQLKYALKQVGEGGLGEVARARTDELRTIERGKRFGAFERSLREGPGGEAGVDVASQALSGKMPEVTFAPPRDLIDQQQIDELFDVLRQSSLRPGDKKHAMNGLKKLLEGHPPQPSEIAKMEEAGLGIRDFIPRNKREWDAWRTLGEAINLPRSLAATGDLSASLRQGIFFSLSHPKEYAGSFADQLRAFKSEDTARAIEDALRNDSWRPAMDDAGVYFAPVADVKTAALGQREEQFISNLQNKIPGIGRLTRASERAYVTMLNKLRADTFKTIAKGWERDGIALTDKRMSDLANYVNNATGRGSLGRAGGLSPAINAAFFSPRFLASRAQLIADLIKPGQDAFVRKQAARDWVIFVGTGISALALLKNTPGVNVEIDPRSSDFAKVRIGNTRFDFWAGFQQPARYTAQLLTGERKVTGEGGVSAIRHLSPADQKDLVVRFIRSKLSPTASLAADVIAGEQLSGEGLNIRDSVLRRVTPLVYNDIWDAVQEYKDKGPEGWAAAAGIGALATLGAGAQTYEPSEGATTSVASTRFEGIAKKAWQSEGWQGIFADAGLPMLANYDSLSDARDAYADYWGPRLAEQEGIPENEARNRAKSYFNSLPAIQQFTDSLSNYKITYWREHPDEFLDYAEAAGNLTEEETRLYQELKQQ